MEQATVGATSPGLTRVGAHSCSRDGSMRVTHSDTATSLGPLAPCSLSESLAV